MDGVRVMGRVWSVGWGACDGRGVAGRRMAVETGRLRPVSARNGAVRRKTARSGAGRRAPASSWRERPWRSRDMML